jgi:alpha-glucoside transport system permease protein
MKIQILGFRTTLGQLLVHLSLLALVLLWILPTVGLLVSSFRDKDQLAATGWWTALSTSKQNAQGRTGTSKEMVEENGKYVISGVLFEETGRTILSFNTNFRDLSAYQAGETLTLKDGGRITVEADGTYRWESEQPIEEKRGKRIFFVAEVPPTFTIANYVEVLTSEGIGQSFINTFVVTIPATIIPITIAAFAAYAFAWMRFPGRQLLFVIVVGLLVVPLQMSLIPLLRMYNSLGEWFDLTAKSYPGIWLAHTGFGLPMAIYLLRNYMGTLPKDIIESARMDGATHFQIFTKLVIPLSVPALASFTIFQFLWVWNDLLVALVFLGKSDDQIVLTSKMRELLGSRGDNWEILTSSAFISIVVPLIVFFALQRYFVRGLVAGSVKGG